MSQKERISERQKIRAKIAKNYESEQLGPALLLISESLDDYILHRIEADKVLEGVLKDIQGNIAGIAENSIKLGVHIKETHPN